MIRRILLYGFPVFIILLEILLRSAYSIDSKGLVGPALAATAIGLLLPLTSQKRRDLQLPHAITEKLKGRGIMIIPKTEKTLIEAVWLILFVFVLAWAYAVYLSCRQVAGGRFGLTWCQMIGIVTYIIGVVLTEIREVV